MSSKIMKYLYDMVFWAGALKMNASSFITFFRDMLRQNAIRFKKNTFDSVKMIPSIKKTILPEL